MSSCELDRLLQSLQFLIISIEQLTKGNKNLLVYIKAQQTFNAKNLQTNEKESSFFSSIELCESYSTPHYCLIALEHTSLALQTFSCNIFSLSLQTCHAFLLDLLCTSNSASLKQTLPLQYSFLDLNSSVRHSFPPNYWIQTDAQSAENLLQLLEFQYTVSCFWLLEGFQHFSNTQGMFSNFSRTTLYCFYWR